MSAASFCRSPKRTNLTHRPHPSCEKSSATSVNLWKIPQVAATPRSESDSSVIRRAFSTPSVRGPEWLTVVGWGNLHFVGSDSNRLHEAPRHGATPSGRRAFCSELTESQNLPYESRVAYRRIAETAVFKSLRKRLNGASAERDEMIFHALDSNTSEMGIEIISSRRSLSWVAERGTIAVVLS